MSGSAQVLPMGRVVAGGGLFSLLVGSEYIGGRRALHDAAGRLVGLWKLWIRRFEEET